MDVKKVDWNASWGEICDNNSFGKQARYSDDFWNKKSDHYNQADYGEAQRVKDVISIMKVDKNTSLLDIGCGTYPLFLVNSDFREKYGLDKIGPRLSEDIPGQKITVVKHDIEGGEPLPFKSGYFNAVTMLAVIEHIEPRNLPRLVAGEVLGAWGLTEAGAGSDAAGMRTTAVRQGDCWVVDGAKTFITHGRIGGVMVVMAITDAAKGHRGISAFIVEHGTAGMTAGRKENKLGMRASDTSEVIFQDCRVPSSQLLGEEGRGFIDTLQVLDAGRIGIAALAVGLAQGAYEAARNYARERHQFGQPIAAFQAIQWKLADNATRIEAARLLTYRAAYLKGQGKRMTRESSMAKLFASEAAVKAADDCVQIHGGYGFVKDYPAEKFFRDVKLVTIGEGTSEIQRLVIARQLLGS